MPTRPPPSPLIDLTPTRHRIQRLELELKAERRANQLLARQLARTRGLCLWMVGLVPAAFMFGLAAAFWL